MCYTSGTTGNPKGVVYSHRSMHLHSMAVCMGNVFGLSEQDRVLPVVPMFHANAWGLVYAAMLAGADLIMPDRFLQPAPLVRLIREFKPHVVTTYDENGGYPHPDHIMTHAVTMHAWGTADDAEAYPAAGPPWQPLKLYYHHTFHRERILAIHHAMLARGLESPYAERLESWKEDLEHQRRVTTRVPCAEFFPVRDRALIAHATQIDPDGPWFAVPLEVHQQAWPTEDYELVESLVDVEIPEDDLFAAIRGLAERYDGRRESIAV
jgi:hypothetical protein